MLAYVNVSGPTKKFKFLILIALSFMAFQLPSLSLAEKSVNRPAPDSVGPEALIRFGNNAPYALIVEKKSQKLFVYDPAGKVVKTVNVTTGKEKGDKIAAGDRKTPEGVYFFSDVLEKKDLAQRYGIMALTMNYPNAMDTFEHKNGDGIWLHSTDQPQRAIRQFDTLGCVVVVNSDMLDLAQYISLEKTPVIICETIRFSPPSQRQQLENTIQCMVNNWKTAWEKKDLDGYISRYSDQFHINGMDKAAYRKYKSDLNTRYKNIRVSMEDLSIFSHKDYVVAAFIQSYESELFKSKGIKRLYFSMENGKWKITGEEWRYIKPESPSMIARKYMHPYDPGEKSAGFKKEPWFLSKNPDHYALQLMGVTDEARMIHFIAKYDLGETAGYYRTNRNGKDWFVLIYGDYPDADTAQGAKEFLPDDLKMPSPWVRSLKSIQSAIHQSSGAEPR